MWCQILNLLILQAEKKRSLELDHIYPQSLKKDIRLLFEAKLDDFKDVIEKRYGCNFDILKPRILEVIVERVEACIENVANYVYCDDGFNVKKSDKIHPLFQLWAVRKNIKFYARERNRALVYPEEKKQFRREKAPLAPPSVYTQFQSQHTKLIEDQGNGVVKALCFFMQLVAESNLNTKVVSHKKVSDNRSGEPIVFETLIDFPADFSQQGVEHFNAMKHWHDKCRPPTEMDREKGDFWFQAPEIVSRVPSPNHYEYGITVEAAEGTRLMFTTQFPAESDAKKCPIHQLHSHPLGCLFAYMEKLEEDLELPS